MGGREHLVGRDEPLGRLRAALDSALAGRGGVMLVAGEPGIGKTALLGALADGAADRSVVVAWGQCWDDSMAPPFWPWTQVLRELGHATNPLSEARLPADADQATGEGTSIGSRCSARSARCSSEVAEAHGLVVVLDDLHWADEATLALLSFLSRHVPRSRVLIVGGFRDVDASTSLVRLTGGVEVVTLGARRRGGRRSCRCCGRRSPRDRRCGRRGATSRRQPAVRARADPSGGRRAVLGRRGGPRAGRGAGGRPTPGPPLAGVPRHARRRRRRRGGVRLDVLARTLSGRDDLPDLVAEAVRARILVTPLDELAPLGFAHDLFREVLSAMLSPAIKAQLHLTLARTLDQLRADGVPIAHASVAAHYVMAASLGLRPAALEAVRHSQQAALDAAGQLAFEDAAGHLRRARRAAARRPSRRRRRLDLLLSLGVALDHAGDATEAREVLVEAADLARQLGDTGGFARAAIGTHRLGALSGLSARPQRAAARRGQRPRRPVLAVAGPGAGELGPRAAPHVGPRDGRPRPRGRGRGGGRRPLPRRPVHLAYCLLALHDTSWSVGSAGERLPIVAEMLDLARLAGDRELHAQAQLLKATALLELGDPAAPAELERYCRAAEDLGHAAVAGERCPAEPSSRSWPASSTRPPHSERAAQLGEEIGEPDTPGVRDTLLWELARFRGGWSDFVTEGHWVPPGTWPPIRAVLLTARGPPGGPVGAGRLLPRTGSPPWRAPPRRLDARDHHRSRRLGRQRGPARRCTTGSSRWPATTSSTAAAWATAAPSTTTSPRSLPRSAATTTP